VYAVNNIDEGGVMGRKTLVCGVMVILIAFLMSCAKLPDTGQKTEGNMKMELAEFGDTVPPAWGKLVSVSSASQFPMMVQLWFQDNEGNVYMIPYDVDSNTFNATYRYLKCK